jgi:hypothetical protein
MPALQEREPGDQARQPDVIDSDRVALPGIAFRKATSSDSDFAYGVKRRAFKAYVEQVHGWDSCGPERRRLMI